MNGNTKTLLTSSPPKGPHPYPLLCCGTSREPLAHKVDFLPQTLHVCVSIITFAGKRVFANTRSVRLDRQELSPQAGVAFVPGPP